MTAKIILGKRPKHFKRIVKAPMVEGGEGRVEISFIYRTRTEFGAFVDELFAAADVQPAGQAEEEVKFSLQQALEKTRDSNADYILKVADGWDLDVPFTRDNVVQMCDELPGIAMEIINTYRLAVSDGRLGN